MSVLLDQISSSTALPLTTRTVYRSATSEHYRLAYSLLGIRCWPYTLGPSKQMPLQGKKGCSEESRRDSGGSVAAMMLGFTWLVALSVHER